VGAPPSPGTYQDTTLNGSLETTANIGEVVITNLTSNQYNAWRGNLGQTAGSGALPQTVIMPRLWSNLDFSENRFVGGMYGVAIHPHYCALYIDDNSNHYVSAQGEISVDRLLYVLDGHNMTYAGFRNVATSNYPGIINATLHFLGDGWTYNLGSHSPIVTIDDPGNSPHSNKFQLSANYPNPFNPVTFFEFHLPESQFIRLEIYNMLGQMVEQLVHQKMSAGAHKIRWNASDYSSGVYYYQLSGESDTLTGKCLLLK
jgi:hypothetical protein